MSADIGELAPPNLAPRSNSEPSPNTRSATLHLPFRAGRRRHSWQPEERLSKPATGDEGSPLRHTPRAAGPPLQGQYFWPTDKLQFASRRAAFDERVLEILMAVTHPDRNIDGTSSLAPGRRGAIASNSAAFARG